MQNSFTKKFIPILLIIFTCFLFFLSSKVFAASYDLSDYKNHISGNNWVILYNTEENTFYLVNGKSSYLYLDYLTVDEDGTYTSKNGQIVCSSSLSNSPWSSLSNVTVSTFDLETLKFGSPVSYGIEESSRFRAGSSIVVASGTNIYALGNTSVFFQTTPVPSVVYIQPLTLAEELEKAETVEVFKKLMMNVVVSLVVSLVGFLSLRKAWTFLKKDLKKA